jgi:hypothetical protein
MQVPSSRHRRALLALAALVLGLALPLLAAAATDVDVAAAAPLEDASDVALDRLAPIVAAPAVRTAPVPAPVSWLVAVLPAVLLAALARPRPRRPVLWTLVRPDRVTAARRGSPSSAWRAPPPVA